MPLRGRGVRRLMAKVIKNNLCFWNPSLISSTIDIFFPEIVVRCLNMVRDIAFSKCKAYVMVLKAYQDRHGRSVEDCERIRVDFPYIGQRSHVDFRLRLAGKGVLIKYRFSP